MWYTNIIGAYLYRYYKSDAAYNNIRLLKHFFFRTDGIGRKTAAVETG